MDSSGADLLLLQNLEMFQSGGGSVLPHLGAHFLSNVQAIKVVVSASGSLAVKGKFPAFPSSVKM